MSQELYSVSAITLRLKDRKSPIRHRLLTKSSQPNFQEEQNYCMATIHAAEKPIKDIFHRDFAFSIPAYQRPYSWGTEQATTLLDDLVTASASFVPSAKSQTINPYFLGSIVVIKQDNESEAEVIDGQQRLTTLSLLLSALRVNFVDPKRQDTFSKFLLEEGDTLVGTRDRCRLVLRDRDHKFYEQNVLRHQKLDHFCGLLNGKLSDPQRRLAENTQALVEGIKKLNELQRESLAAFMLQHTYLVVVSTPSLESAFRIFSVLNDRGLDLTVADILKAEVIGKIVDVEQPAYVEKWEDAEQELGTQRFADLFSHIRMIHARKKLRTSVLEGFRAVVPLTSPKMFIDEQLIPLADASNVVLSADYECANKVYEVSVNRTLRWLLRLSDRDWMPVALRIITHYATRPELVASLLVELERLAATMWLLRFDENDRIERHAKVLEEISADTATTGKLASVLRSEKEKAYAKAVLMGDIYNLSPKPKRTFVLLRLDQALSSGEARYDFETITVEHVLPQTPPDASEWVTWWPDAKEREQSVHRIGNLALLNRRQNSAAKNWDFDTKKSKYFQKKTGGSPFQITSQVLKESTWTPIAFERRQAEAVAKLEEVWDLGTDATPPTT